ncbi:MAG: alginate export family protein [Pseudomonadota bacterium]
MRTNTFRHHALHAFALTGLVLSAGAHAESASLAEAITGGDAYLNFNTRYEYVDQDNPLDEGSALTLLTRFGYKTGTWNKFSAHVEFEDSRILLGFDEYAVPPTGFNTGEFSVIADPETTELDQAYVQYADAETGFSLRVGRQIVSYDSQRFVGAVPWRQDWQTFDGVHAEYTGIDKLKIKAGHLYKRNRIFATDGDLDSSDNLIDITYQTPFGTLGGYAYLLEVDSAVNNSLDTVGVRFTGSQPIGENKLSYKFEYATQDAEQGAADFDADYLLAEGALALKPVTIKLGLEVLGSDDGQYGFATPLATLHKFNGWADLFLATPAAGLEDIYVAVSGKFQKFGYSVIYHDFTANESLAGADDLGSEINLLLTRPLGDRYKFGFKYADYSAGSDSFATVDTERLWLWLSAKF